MNKFEEYLEAVNNINKIINIASDKGPRNRRNADGVYHFFEDIYYGAEFGYDPKIYKQVNFEKLKDAYRVKFELGDIEELNSSEEDVDHSDIPKGYVGFKWGKLDLE